MVRKDLNPFFSFEIPYLMREFALLLNNFTKMISLYVCKLTRERKWRIIWKWLIICPEQQSPQWKVSRGIFFTQIFNPMCGNPAPVRFILSSQICLCFLQLTVSHPQSLSHTPSHYKKEEQTSKLSNKQAHDSLQENLPDLLLTL